MPHRQYTTVNYVVNGLTVAIANVQTAWEDTEIARVRVVVAANTAQIQRNTSERTG